MESKRYLEGRYLNEPPFFENENFLIWKNEFESYVKSIDRNLWHVISFDDLQLMKGSFANKFFIRNFCKIFEAKILIYESLPKINFDKNNFMSNGK